MIQLQLTQRPNGAQSSTLTKRFPSAAPCPGQTRRQPPCLLLWICIALHGLPNNAPVTPRPELEGVDVGGLSGVPWSCVSD